MQSRRHQDYTTMPTSSSKSWNNQTGRSELGNHPYQISYRDAPDRAPRSLSPRKVDGSRRFSDGHRASDSTDRRDYGFHLGGGRSEGVHAKSPQYRLSHKKDQFEDGVAHRKYGHPEDEDFDHGANSRLKDVYGYDHSTSRASKERDYGDKRVVDIGSRGMLSQKSIPLEEEAIRGLYQLPSDIGPAKNYGEPGGSLPLSCRSMDVGSAEGERLQYRQPIPSDKLAALESYKEEKHAYHSRDRQPIPSDKLAAMESYQEGKHAYHSRDRQPIPSDKLAAMESYQEGKPAYHSRDRQPIPSDKLAAMESYQEGKHAYHSRDRQPIPSDKLAAMESYKGEKHAFHSRERQPIPSDKLAAMESYKEEKHAYHSRNHQPIPSDKLAAMESYKEEKHVFHSRDKLPIMESYREGEKPVYHSRDKLPVMESYREGEKPIFHSRDILYTTVPDSHSKDILSTSQYKDFVSTSSVAPMNEYSVSYVDDLTFPASDGYSKSSIKLNEPIGFSSYGQRSQVDSTSVAEPEARNFIYNQRGAYDSSRTEREDFVYPKTSVIVSDDRGYLSDDVRRMTSPRIQHEYNHAPMDYDHMDLARPSNMIPVVDSIDNSEHSRGDLRKSNVLDHPTLQKHTVSDYLDTSRKSYAYSASNHAEFERQVPRDYGVSHMDVSQGHQISYLRSDYVYGRDAGQVVHEERYLSSSDPLYDSEAHKIAVRTHGIEEELGIREPYGKLFKRKNLEDDMNRHDSRTIMSRKWYAPEEFEDLYDGDECFDEGMSGAHLSKTRRFNNNERRKGGRAYDGQEQYGNFAYGDRFSTRDSLVHSQGSSIRYYKNSGKYVKANPRLGSLSRHSSHHGDRRTGLNKQHKVWKRIEDYDEDVHENDGDTSEEWSNLAESEPSEDTEEFKELVQKAFLLYAKKLNVNPSVRRRYKEQGKAGSLFCIACGRSMSKEFMNTQSLVRHAFMSHKVGLRAMHLGLQKAICVLMGWNSVVPHDMITWVPDVLHDEEAMAQKEDLILWPPVVIIRNISMSNNNPKEQKVVPIEGVEAFLRGEGFIGGKITVCLGRPADQSVMVVKFLGTFTGLGNAEKLHKYFVEHKHGRAEFVQLTSSNSRSSINVEAQMHGDKLEEQLLYGYMGVSEDLDSVDFNTKKYCFIKSKKEILDLANAPVKPD
ncbi:hypothetical protein WN944_018735 [Citrus x changshan-huyou]|uniref:Uncharacterized protein n=2 Tax=Citrus TaxID=2706 RepID=A0ACB8L694_CITSI|nr:hypothetical protein KPL71_011789 [Citrus sinensis]